VNGREVEGGVPFHLTKGDVIVLELPGGGGFGPPEARDKSLIEQDHADQMA